jgi:hypothetical protein
MQFENDDYELLLFNWIIPFAIVGGERFISVNEIDSIINNDYYPSINITGIVSVDVSVIILI